jgi:alkanesulfonate monooxygenase SsuD/methylene tetrahydromethanopterin reductase-like flavin-dependent oxidoreductase (luciferase family)
MKFGNFLFPDCRDPARDGVVIDETLQEAWLSDELGVDVIWLAEHHFDGICAYVDPVSFASALATFTRRSKIGFAVVQMALHHPIRLAEQLAILDNITKGRLIVGLGRGSSYNIYDTRASASTITRRRSAWRRRRRSWSPHGPAKRSATMASSGVSRSRCCARVPIQSPIRCSSAPLPANPRCSNSPARAGRS